MKVVAQTHTHLKLEHYPWMTWLGALGILSVAPSFYLADRFPKSAPGLLFLLFVASVVGVIVLIQLTGQVATCDFYKSLNVVTLKRRGLFGVTVIERALQDISSIQVIEEIRYTKGRKYRRYSICLNMFSGEEFHLTTDRLFNQSVACDSAKVISEFLNLQYTFVSGADNNPWRIF